MPARRQSHSAEAALVVRELCATRGAFQLGPISLTLQRGDHLVLMGPSGCGKTTLLKTLAGLLPSNAGEIHIGGQRMDGVPSQQRRVGYVPQHSLLFPHLTVADNVRFGLRYADFSAAQRRERFAQAVAQTDVGGLLGRYPATLSGGEARRVALARALAVGPAVLLLDEPLSMLDADARAALLAALRDIARERRVAVMHVTHYSEEAAAVATRIVAMQAGRLIVGGQ